MLLGALAAGSCREPVSPPAARTPVFSLILVAGESLQVGSITLAAPADSAIPDAAVPAAAGAIALTVTDPVGNGFPVVAGPVPGQFLVHFTPVPNTAYALSGTMYGVPVTARAVVPASFAMLIPAADTIRIADGSATLATLRIPYEFQSLGAAGFAYRVIAGGALELAAPLRSPRGEIVVAREPQLRRLAVLAYDDAAAGWLVSGTPRSNVAGAFGCFGAALLVRRYVDAP